MSPQKKIFNICPSEIAPKRIVILSPGIDDISSISQLLVFSVSVTPEKITPKKTELPVIRKMPKTDHGGYDY